MSLENLALSKTDDLPIRHIGEIHNGKVRSVYWLAPEDSQRIIEKKGYEEFQIPFNTDLGIMVISDRISAFDAKWQGENGLAGVPGKGAALNAISLYWFDNISREGIIEYHILESPHPLVWIVQRASPIMIEAVARQYITGSMWRRYVAGERRLGEVTLPDGLQQYQKLDEIVLTPTTKGVIRGNPDIPEEDDVELRREQIFNNYSDLGLINPDDVSVYESILRDSFGLISRELEALGQLFVDTKFEFGYVKSKHGTDLPILIDEVGTPDSSRMWDAEEYKQGRIVENSKEGFRQFLIGVHGDILTRGTIGQRKAVAASYKVPVEQMMDISKNYMDMAQLITGQSVPQIKNPREEILEALSEYDIVMGGGR